jgi:predicted heme/steroid binding protein
MNPGSPNFSVKDHQDTLCVAERRHRLSQSFSGRAKRVRVPKYYNRHPHTPAQGINSNSMKKLSREELKHCNGQHGAPAYIGCNGKLYDVSCSWHWKECRHHALHMAGEDLTKFLSEAPHGADMLERVPEVGKLVD